MVKQINFIRQKVRRFHLSSVNTFGSMNTGVRSFMKIEIHSLREIAPISFLLILLFVSCTQLPVVEEGATVIDSEINEQASMELSIDKPDASEAQSEDLDDLDDGVDEISTEVEDSEANSEALVSESIESIESIESSESIESIAPLEVISEPALTQ